MKNAYAKDQSTTLSIQVSIIAVCIVAIAYLYYTMIYPDRQAPRRFYQVDCIIMNERLSSTGEFFITRYRADFLVSYNINQNQYSAWVSGNGLDQSYFFDRQAQQYILKQFDVGRMYPCFVNPSDPEQAFLTTRKRWTSAWLIFVPLIIGAVTLLAFLITLLSRPR